MQASITYKHDLPCSTVELLFLKICKNLTMKLAVKYLPNFIFRCKFLYLATQNCLRSGNEKNINMILGCKRIHKPGGTFSGFSLIFIELWQISSMVSLTLKCLLSAYQFHLIVINSSIYTPLHKKVNTEYIIQHRMDIYMYIWLVGLGCTDKKL